MPESKPLLTVAMPVYNAGQHLRLAVLSVIHQSETNWELLIIDDGSTDNALASIKDIIDPRILILNDGTNKGLAQRLNEAMDLARGKYFARMDQDDVSYPERFARQLKALQENPALDLVATRAILIDEHNRGIGVFPAAVAHEEICTRPWRGFYFPHPTWLGRTDWFRQYRYRIPGPYLCEDQELLLRSYRDSRFATVDEVLFAYRVRDRVSLRKLFRTRRSVLSMQMHHFTARRQWRYFVFSLAVLAARLSGDVAKYYSRKIFRMPSPVLPAQQSGKWLAVLDKTLQQGVAA